MNLQTCNTMWISAHTTHTRTLAAVHGGAQDRPRRGAGGYTHLINDLSRDDEKRGADRFCSPKHSYSFLLDQNTAAAAGLMYIHVGIKRGPVHHPKIYHQASCS